MYFAGMCMHDALCFGPAWHECRVCEQVMSLRRIQEGLIVALILWPHSPDARSRDSLDSIIEQIPNDGNLYHVRSLPIAIFNSWVSAAHLQATTS